MRYYKSYTAKKLKLPKRILFFVIIALVILLFAILLGNHLKRELEESEVDTSPVETVDMESVENPSGEEGGGAVHDVGTYSAGYLALSADTDMRTAVNAIRSGGFSAVSFVAADESGLRYASPAASELSRLPASESLISYTSLCDAVSYAEGLGLRSSAVFTSGGDTVDPLIIAELCTAGFDEIIIRGFESILGEEGGSIDEAVEYLEAVRTVADCDISLSLSRDAYIYARNSYHIEKLFTYCEFLTVDLVGSTGETAASFADGFAGSIQTYSLRVLVGGEDSAAVEALYAAEQLVYQYISAAPTAVDSTTASDE